MNGRTTGADPREYGRLARGRQSDIASKNRWPDAYRVVDLSGSKVRSSVAFDDRWKYESRGSAHNESAAAPVYAHAKGIRCGNADNA